MQIAQHFTAKALCQRLESDFSTLSCLDEADLNARLPQLLRLEEAMSWCLSTAPTTRNSMASPLLTGKPQIASYIIDKTFDDHKSLLRNRLEVALAELERLRDGNRLLAAEAALEDTKARFEVVLKEKEDLLIALENSQQERRSVLLAARGAQHAFLGWHQALLMKLIATFTVCEEWRDWQLEAYLSTRLPDIQSMPANPATEKKRPPQPPPVALPVLRSNRTPPPPSTTTQTSNRMTPVPYGEGPSTITKAVIHPREARGKQVRGGNGGLVAHTPKN